MMVQAFARAQGCSVQWARLCRRENRPEWQAFLAGPKQKVEVVYTAGTDFEKAREAEERCWQAYLRADELARQCDDPAMLAALNRAAAVARAAHEKAARQAKQAAIDERRYVPLANVEGLRVHIGKLGELVQQWRTKVAGRMPQEMRQAFFEAFDESRADWNTEVESLDGEIRALMPC